MNIRLAKLKALGFLYEKGVRPVFFLFDSEKIHGVLIDVGAFFGKIPLLPRVTRWLLNGKQPELAQVYFGLHFSGPIGMAAGFDYEAKLTQATAALGFGFQSVGTITNGAYEGNPYPRLGRLPKSKSLLVNKGFKNEGIRVIEARLAGTEFPIPIGISIGKTNSHQPMTQIEAVADIVEAFRIVEGGSVPWNYYELNISCPNLYGNVEFYAPAHLKELLSAVTSLKLKRPLFIKMPIDKSDTETLEMLAVIASFPVQAVIFGNLQKNKADPAIDQTEAAKFTKGFYSGKPTEKQSNELIALAFKKYGSKLKIIGCGGVFSAEDAYKKIRLGTSLVQLITGLIYRGPFLPAEINAGLTKLLRRDGFKHISEAIGADSKRD